ncbi:uncharacterized protein [Heptranchias perlo]|uniref:uncharacterized protein n=1 Tax=Heptranchias perlo TaxID=212740 RepID=UPI0035593F27
MKMHRLVSLLAVLGVVLSNYGTEAQQEQESADLIFLIDGSSNLGRDEFQFIHSFIANFIEDLNIGPDAIQIGVVQYSNTPSTEFYLNTYPTKTKVLNAMKNLRQKGGGEANIGKAFQFLVDNHFIPSAGSREAEGVPQVMVLVTSRQSSDDFRRGMFPIKKRGMFTFVVGVRDAVAAETEQIATDPSFSMLAPNVQRMAAIREQLMPLFSLVARKQLVIEVQEPEIEAQVSKRDIVFLIDGSSSVGNANFLQICEFILNIVDKFEIGPDSVRVAVVQYNDVATTEFHLNTHMTKSALQTAVKRLRLRGHWALNTGAALDYVFKNHFTRAAGSRKEDGVPQFLVLITGERSRDDVKRPADALKRAAVMTFAIGAMNADPAQLTEIAIDSSLVFNVDKFQNLPEVQEQVMTPLSTLAGVTIVYEQPTAPVKKEIDKRDIVFLIDGSFHVGSTNLPAIRDFITRIIEAFDIGSDRVQVGLVQYSNVAEPEFFLNTYSSKDELLSHIRRLRLKGGTVLKTGAALDYVLKYLFTKYSGSRKEEGVPQFLVLITGGKSRDDMKQPSDALLQAGVTTLAIGAQNAIKQQLQVVSSDPSLVFGVKEFRSLPEIQQEVLLPLSTLTGVRKTSELLTTPATKDVTEAYKSDIVFLIDGSFQVGSTNLPAIRDFITRIIETLDIGSDRVRVGLVQYSDVAEPEFFLNTYSSKDELVSHLRRLRLKGGTVPKTGAALDYVLKYIFTKYSGSRKEEGVPQFLVLVTGGRSRDNIKPPSDALLRAGVMTLAIGAGNAVKQDLQDAALDSSLVFNVKDFRSLPEIQQKVLLPLSTLTGVKIISELPTMSSRKDIIDAQERDIVFLIDGSTKAGSSFPFVREFLQGVIQQLDVGLNTNRVAVVQYSENTKVEFPLNAYSNKDDTLAAVRNLRPKGGRVLNTGAALNYVIRNVFTKAAGSRRDAHVPQLLVLLISGKSRDDVKEAAAALKRAAIVTFVIGAMDADGKELQEIAYSSNLLFAVQDFQSLPDIQDQLLQPLKTLLVEVIKMPSSVTEGNKRDVVFLIDGSSNVGTYFYLIRDLIVNLIPNFDVATDKDHISVVQYSDDARIEFPLNAYSSKEKVLAAIGRLRLKGGRRLKTGAALDFVRKNVFSRSGGGRQHLGFSQILVLITSGKSQDDVRRPSEELKQAGVVPFVVGIGDVDKRELNQIAYSPKLSFEVKDYWGLTDLDLRLLTISQNVESVPVPPITSSGVDRRDVVFLIDGSAKIGKGFPTVRQFMAKMVENFDVGKEKVQFGVVQFSENPRTEFFLNTHSTKKNVLAAIKKLKLKRGKKIKIGQALDHVIRNVFTSSAGSRMEDAIPQILLLLTAGKSNDDISQQADKLRKLGIVLFGIGLKAADRTVLEPMAYSTSLAFPVKSFRALLDIQDRLQQIMKTVAVEVVETAVEEDFNAPGYRRRLMDVHHQMLGALESLPESLRTMIRGMGESSSNLAQGFAQSLEPNLSNMERVVTSIITSVEPTMTQCLMADVAASTAAQTAAIVAQTDVIKGLQAMVEAQPAAMEAQTAAIVALGTTVERDSQGVTALQQSILQLITRIAETPSRENGSNNGWLAEDKGVMPDVVEIQKKHRVGTHSVHDTDTSILQVLPQLWYSQWFVPTMKMHPIKMHRLTPLLTIYGLILSLFVTESLHQARKRDIVFLIDGSPGMGRSFPLVREFLIKVIQELDIGPDKDQVAVVQYSSDSRLEFGLNIHSTKSEVLNAIKKLRLKTGRPLNTGDALDFVTQSVFSPSAGSRRDAGVSQILVLITAGKSRDDVGQAADAVKRAGIVPIAIGAKSADTSELQQIVSDPDSVLKLGDFRELQTIQQELLSKVRAVFVIEEPIVPTEVTSEAENKRDIVFLIDESDYTGNSNLPLVRDFITRIVENLDIGSDRVRVGLVLFSNTAETEFYLNTYTRKDELLPLLRALRFAGDTTLNIGKALDFVLRYHFTRSAGSRREEGVPQFLVLITGGRSGDDIQPSANALKRAAVITFTVGARNADPAQLKEIAFEPSLAFNVRDFYSLSDIQEKVMTPLQRLRVQTVPIEEPTASIKKPTIDIEGLLVTSTKVSAARKRDIVFLIDGSLAMGRSFIQVREFLIKVIQELDIGPDKDQVAVVQYSFDPRLEFGLDIHSTKSEILDAVKKLRLKTGRPLNTGAALDFVTQSVFSPSAGSRRDAGASQILVLIIAGKSRDDVGQAADAVKRAGIVPIAIGAKSADTSELQQIVSDPDSVLKLGDFRELQNIQQELLSKVRAVYVIEEPIVPTEVLPKVMSERDIVFLIDGSDNVGNTNLPLVRDFITRIIQNLAIGRDKVRVGLAQYSDDTEAEFYLNTYSSEADLLSHVRSLRLRGGTIANTGSALDFAFKYYFTSSAGSRINEDVPQFLVLVTGGRSSDDVKQPADALKRAAVMTFVVGARNVDPAQLEEIAIDPSLIFNAKEFDSLPDIQNQLIIPLTTLTVPTVIIEEQTIIEEPTRRIEEQPITTTEVSAERKRDIVFLIDGSPAMGRSFSQVREFLTKVIQELNIGPDKDQVAVVQYSSDPRLEFGLNIHSTKNEVLNAIKKLRLKTGRPLNTGAALDFVTQSVFSPSAGSRRDAGASQILVLIIAGKSKDDVGQAADAVKRAGIVPIAIGAKSADTSELQQIVSDPDSVLKLSDFQELQTIQQELLSKVGAVFVIEEPIVPTEVLPKEMSERDIVFLIDGSDNVGNTNLLLVRDFITRIIQNLAIGRDKVRVGLAQYSDDTEAEFYLNTYSSEADLLSHVRNLRLRGGTTVNTGSALDFAFKYYFTRAAGSRINENVPQFLVLVTGGRSSDDVKTPADALKRAAVMTVAVGARNVDPAQLEEIAIDPSLVFSVKEFYSLPDIQNQMIVPLTTLTVPTIIIEEEPTIIIEEEPTIIIEEPTIIIEEEPTTITEEPTIIIEEEPTTITEEPTIIIEEEPTIITEEPTRIVEQPVTTTEAMKRDIVFLIDGSPAMGRSFVKVREFLAKVIQELDIGPDKDQVAVVQYSSDPRLEFGLNIHSTKNEALDAIKKLRLKTGRPLNTGAALDFVTQSVFSPSAGSRRDAGASQILVLIIAGKSRDDVGQAADAVKRAGIVPIAIGAKSADTSELQQIVSDPDSVLKLRDFQELQTIQQELLSKVRVVSVIEEPIVLTEVVPQEVNRRDIVFLIDGSVNVGNVNFIHVREFITRLIENLDIGRDKVQVAVAQYSNDVKTESYLNSYSTKAELVSHVRGLKVKGGRMVNTGAALDYVLRNHFTKSAGSRKEEGVPQVLVLVTGGRSRDDIKSSADALKRAAVTTYAVGARNAGPAQLKEIASDPSLVFSVKEFRSLPAIQNQVMTPLSTPVTTPLSTMIVPTVTIAEVVPQEVNRKDIVFLIDGSVNVGNVNFIYIREFITRLIENLDIGRDKVQVAVAQYSNDVKTESYLNSYSTKAELVSHVKGLKVKGGRMVNTGAALDYVLRNHFTKSAGSRKEEGVPQVLVLVIGGKSRDDIKSSADALKRAAVTTYAVGARNAGPAQLKEMASDPSLVFSVKEFRSLPAIQNQVMTPLSVQPALQLIPEEPTVTIKQVLPKRVNMGDIVFLIDQSDNVGNTDFPFIRDFLTSIIQNLDIGQDRVQIGLVLYSNYAETEFYLNTYSSEDGILPHVKGLRQRGGMPLNTGAALDYVLRNHFTRSSGSRKEDGIPQILVLVTAGRSRDYIKQSADALKRAAVTIFAVGARNTDPAQLKQIASDPSLSLNVQEFHSLPHIEEQMMTSLSTLPASREPTVVPTVPIKPAKITSKRDIVFLIDGSDNVGDTDFPFIRDFLTSIIENLDIGSDRVQIGVVQYSNYAETEFYLNTYSSEDEILPHVEGLRQRGGMPLNTGAALDYVLKRHFTRSSGSRKEDGVPQILVLVTAGRSRDYIKQSADALKRAAVTIFAVGARNADPAQLKQIASDPSLSLNVQEFHSLQRVEEQMMTSLSTLPASREPTVVPTVPIKPVVSDGGSKRDIVFLIDGSDNVGDTDFPFVRDFLTSIIENFDIGSDRIQIGLVQYSNYAETEFYLNTYSSVDEILPHVEGLSLRGGSPLNTGAALDYVLKSHFTRSSGSRKEDGVPQVLLLVTAGSSKDYVKPSADALKQAAIMIFAVGARNADPAQLKEIAIDPSLIFNVQEFHSLPHVQEQVMTPLTTLAASRVPTERPTAPIEQVLPEEVKRDIVFLIDGSDNIGNTNFPFVRDFLTSIIQRFDIGSDRVQIGLVQYSNYAETEFYLNTHLSKAEILSHVKGLRLKGGTSLNTGAALDYVFRYHFISSAGSRKRKGVPQFLVLLTGGRSSDDVKPAADALKRAAIMNFAVGTKNADSAQLKEIAIDPSLVFSTNEFYALPYIQAEVTTLLSSLPAPRAIPEEPTVLTKQVVPDGANKRDIVFLIDGSDNVGNTNFPLVRDFLTSIIENLDIGSDRDQIGLVQYSNYAETEFYLNTYSSVDEILPHVEGLRLRGGSILNTGAALLSVLRYHFTRSAGSRKDKGVPQILVLITNGRSGDDIKPPADALKQAAVKIFAVGARNADSAQLKEIAIDPGLVFSVQEFHSLPQVQEQVMISLSTLAAPTVTHEKSTVITERPTDTITEVTSEAENKRDIVFLIDESDYTGNSNLPLVRDFITRIVENLDIGSDRVRVGLVLFSNTAETEFYLNTYTRKDELLPLLRALRFEGGTALNIGKALDFVLRYHFTRSAGSRREEGVPQFLVLITGGQSGDDIQPSADALKRAAVITFTVGARNANPAQLKEIAFEPSLAFNVRDFYSLSDIQEKVMTPLQRLRVQTVPIEEPTVHIGEPVVTSPKVVPDGANKRDIVFLIDGSDNVGNTNFPLVRDFLTSIIENLDIGSDRDQIGLVQYSNYAETEFYLNTYSSVDEILPHVEGLRLRGGSTLNTGAALLSVLRYHFTRSAGSRKDKGVPQILVLITNGRSGDDIKPPADALKQAAVKIFAVGARNADSAQLKEIAIDPGLVFSVQEFHSLPQVQEQVMISLSTLAAPTVTHEKSKVITERPTDTITEVTSEAENKRDIVFLIDESDYTGNSNLPLVRDFITRIVENLDIGSDRVRVGLVLFSNTAETEFYLNTYTRKDELLPLLRALRFEGGTALNIGKALDFVLRYHFTRSAGSRREEGVPQFLVLITGGQSGDDIQPSADALKRAAVITFTVGARNANPAQLKEIAFEPSLAFNVRDFYSLSDIQEKVMTPLQRLRVQTVPIEEPTVHIGEPVVTSPKVSTERKRDIVFLIDGSPTMGRSFPLVREFLTKVIEELDIGPDKDQVAVVQYSSDPRVEFGLDTYSTKNEVLNAIKKLRLKTGRPLNTGAALDFVTQTVFSPSAGSRRDAGASQILVLIIAGKSRDDVGQAADAVKRAGIVPIAIGAKSADTSELQQIVSDPDSVLKLSDFRELQTIQQELLSKVRAVFVIEEPIIPTEVTPKEMSERDIVFLIDGSDNVGNTNLPLVRDFIARIIQNLAIGRDKVRVGLAQYSDDTEAEFYLNTYSSEADLLSHVRNLRLRGGTTANTGSALDFAFKYYFTGSAGSRIKEDIPQFLVLVTGGRSSDDVKQPADALKRAAVMTFVVGARNVDPAQLEEIAIDPSLIFNAKEFDSLPDIQNQLIIPLTTLTVPTVIIEEPIKNIEEHFTITEVSAARKRDIVFLIDGSPGMGRSFPLVREFLTKVIQEFDIGPDKDQVAVVQYSSDQRVEFSLNSHSTKDEVLNGILKLRLKTGRPLNTAAALDFVTQTVFSPSAGSRRDAGASQILVLITAGKSKDDVGQAADAVKRAGIVPIAIGAKSADTSELQQIVYEPNFVMKLRDFRELQSIQKELISKVKTVFIIEESTAVNTEVLAEGVNKRDIVFLIDGSDNIGNTNLLLVHDFIRNIIENLDIGSDRVQVGLAQFSHNTKTEFYLDTYSTKAEILSHVKRFKLKGGTKLNTGAALDFVFRNHFTSHAGSRKEHGVPQFLVVFTGGRSVDAIKPSADALKRAAITTFAVGVRNANPAELQEIATSPKLVFSVKEFHNLPHVQERVMTPLSTLTAPTVTTGGSIIIEQTVIVGEPQVTSEEARQRDIVFLIDGTLGMGKAFPQVREFLIKVIEELDIGPDKDQVAVVQYSTDSKIEFGLNTYANKDEILVAITQLRRKTGRVLNTGTALDYVTRNVFTTSAGSREDAGATQILVLIAAGKSRDDVGQAAAAVKRAGIVPIAIGAKSVDSSELQQIVYSPDFVFVLKTFHTVPTIQQQLISILKSVSVEPLEDQPH